MGKIDPIMKITMNTTVPISDPSPTELRYAERTDHAYQERPPSCAISQSQEEESDRELNKGVRSRNKYPVEVDDSEI